MWPTRDVSHTWLRNGVPVYQPHLDAKRPTIRSAHPAVIRRSWRRFVQGGRLAL